MMFGTLRYDRESQHAEFIDRTDSFLGDAATEHAACDKCRLTKLRCTGQRSGCDRCKVRGIQCVYSATGTRESRKAKARKNSNNTATGLVDSKVVKKQRQQSQQSPQQQGEQPQKRERKATTVLKTGGKTNLKVRKRELLSYLADHEEKESRISDEMEEEEEEDPLPVLREEGDGDTTMTTEPASKTERGLSHDFGEHRVMDVLATWPQPHHLSLDLEMTPSPYARHGLPDMVALDPGFLTSSLMDAVTSQYPELDQPDGGTDDGNFAFFTSDSPFSTSAASESLDDSSPSSTEPSSEGTSPMFTEAPASPSAGHVDVDVGDAPLDMASKSCGCLGILVTMLDDLGDLVDPPSGPITLVAPNPTIDDMLASLKTQISNVAKILRCTFCLSRDEHISLLTRACEMLARLGERIVLSYQGGGVTSKTGSVGPIPSIRNSTPPPTPAASPPDFITRVSPAQIEAVRSINPADLETSCALTPTTVERMISPSNIIPFVNAGDLADGMMMKTTHNVDAMFFGRYKTDPSEYKTLMRVLIGLQLRAISGLFRSIITGSDIRQSETAAGAPSTALHLSAKQIARMNAAQAVVGALIVRLEDFNSEDGVYGRIPESGELTSLLGE